MYSAAWRLCCGTATVLGLGIALLVWPVAGVLVTFVLTTVLIGIGCYVLDERASLSRIPGRSARAVVWGRAAAGGLAAVAFGGLAEVSVALTFVLAAVGAATSPRVLRRLRSRSQPVGKPARQASVQGPDDAQELEIVARDVDEATVSSLSNAELCLAWRCSYVALLEASSVRRRAIVVASRQVYLDEMEQRDPAGLNAWLCSGARAASGPDRYLGGASG